MKMGRKAKIGLGIGVAISGLCFAYKIIEFIWTLDSPEAPGFAVVPVITYFIVALGFALLFLWAFLEGQFAHMERPKDRFLRREADLERRGI